MSILKTFKKGKHIAALALGAMAAVWLTLPAWGQQFRASISGTVTDPQRAVIAGATVEVRNLETQFVTSVQTNDAGIYTAPFLTPGTYRVSATAPGFKRVVRDNVVLNIGSQAQVDLVMELGEVTESVTISAEAEQLETARASIGQAISAQKVADLPNLGRNPFLLATLATGVDNWSARSKASQYNRPFDGPGAQLSVGGVGGRYQILLNGIPNNPPERGTPIYMGFVPSPDAVEEVNVQTNLYDAQYGRTSGAVINSVLRSGTNDFHGRLFHFFRNDVLNANTFESNWGNKPKAVMRWNQPGFVLDGPVRIPNLYDGRNRTYFMLSLEWIRNSNPSPFVGTVPDEYQRQGDFSRLVQLNGQPITIYDPLTTANVGGQWIRQPFPNNKIPSGRINPVSAKIVPYWPQPNAQGNLAGANNYVSSPNSQTDKYNSVSLRMDQQLSEKHKLMGTWIRNVRNQFFPTAGFPAESSPGYLHYRNNHGGNLDLTSVLSPFTVLNIRYGFLYHPFALERYGDLFDLSKLGFPSSLLSQLPRQTFPGISLSDFSGLQEGSSQYNTTTTHSLTGVMTKTVGSHVLKTGAEFFAMRSNLQLPVSNFGTFSFSRAFTQRNAQSGDAASGNGFATFLLGTPTGGSVNYNIASAYQLLYYGFFVQDDWRVTRRLTVNLGLRWDYEGPMSERYNRQNRGFAFDAPSPLQVPGLNLKGGLLFTDENNRLPFERDLDNWQPRIGAAYRLTDRMVIRGGYGIMHPPTFDTGYNNGYSVSTGYVASIDGNLTPANSLSNPYPDGILQPPGRSKGLATLLGQGFSFADPTRTIPKVHQFSVSLQRQLPWQTVVEVAYSASRTREWGVSKGINSLPAQYFSLGSSVLLEQVDNPMAGLLPGSGLNSAKITRQSLLVPYPQFGGITQVNKPVGEMSYNSLQIIADKRLSHGISFRLSYTWNKIMTETGYLNNQDAWENLARVQASEPNHNLTISGGYQLPFFADSRSLAGYLLGGWQLHGVFRWTTGTLVNAPSGAFSSGVNPKLPDSQRTYQRYFNTCTLTTSGARQNCASASEPVAFIQQPPYTLRTLSTVLPGIRTDIPPNMDMSLFKDFPIRERLKMQFRAEAFNISNTPQFGGPNTTLGSSQFGLISPSQVNDPRIVQLGLKLMF